MLKKTMNQFSLMNITINEYDKDSFYFVFFDYNEGERVIINNKYANKVLNICLDEKECNFLRESHYYIYKSLDSFTKILQKYNIEYKMEWFDIEY